MNNLGSCKFMSPEGRRNIRLKGRWDTSLISSLREMVWWMKLGPKSGKDQWDLRLVIILIVALLTAVRKKLSLLYLFWNTKCFGSQNVLNIARLHCGKSEPIPIINLGYQTVFHCERMGLGTRLVRHQHNSNFICKINCNLHSCHLDGQSYMVLQLHNAHLCKKRNWA